MAEDLVVAQLDSTNRAFNEHRRIGRPPAARVAASRLTPTLLAGVLQDLFGGAPPAGGWLTDRRPHDRCAWRGAATLLEMVVDQQSVDMLLAAGAFEQVRRRFARRDSALPALRRWHVSE
eukprot:7040051-Prymnesium_polylepis.1